MQSWYTKVNHFLICQHNAYVWFKVKNTKLLTPLPKIKYSYKNMKEKGVRFTRGENHTLKNALKENLEQCRDGLCSWMRRLISNCKNTGWFKLHGAAWKKQMLNDDMLYDASNHTWEKVEQ